MCPAMTSDSKIILYRFALVYGAVSAICEHLIVSILVSDVSYLFLGSGHCPVDRGLYMF